MRKNYLGIYGLRNSFIFTMFFMTHLHAQTPDQNTKETMSLNIAQSLNFASGPRLASFWERDDSVAGSPYLVKTWLRGIMEFRDHQPALKSSGNTYFNLNKFTNEVIVTFGINRKVIYPADSVSNLILEDSSSNIYRFITVPNISSHFFLQPLVESQKGYSLYIRLLTTLHAADYEYVGYKSIGDRHDTYTDQYEYYLLFPDKHTFQKFYLKDQAVKKALTKHTDDFSSLLKTYSPPIDTQILVNMIDSVNKKY